MVVSLLSENELLLTGAVCGSIFFPFGDLRAKCYERNSETNTVQLWGGKTNIFALYHVPNQFEAGKMSCM